jgi:GNAT superfamily N-acetyltransferase
MAEFEIRQVGADQLAAVGSLFSLERATRHCWCMAFCSTRWQFATGWYGGGNRRRFESMAVSEPSPLGVIAVSNGEPVGWCGCGPRARFKAALAGRTLLIRRPSGEDDDVWLIACIVVRPDRRGSGVVLALLRGAISLTRQAGASAVEAWPLAHGVRRPGEAHLGREGAFARLGFQCIERPNVERVIMRLELTHSTIS